MVTQWVANGCDINRPPKGLDEMAKCTLKQCYKLFLNLYNTSYYHSIHHYVLLLGKKTLYRMGKMNAFSVLVQSWKQRAKKKNRFEQFNFQHCKPFAMAAQSERLKRSDDNHSFCFNAYCYSPFFRIFCHFFFLVNVSVLLISLPTYIIRSYHIGLLYFTTSFLVYRRLLLLFLLLILCVCECVLY